MTSNSPLHLSGHGVESALPAGLHHGLEGHGLAQVAGELQGAGHERGGGLKLS